MDPLRVGLIVSRPSPTDTYGRPQLRGVILDLRTTAGGEQRQ
jgi:hypothetical protein